MVGRQEGAGKAVEGQEGETGRRAGSRELGWEPVGKQWRRQTA